MALTNETLREMLLYSIGFDPGPAEVERLRPLVERQLERMKELHALDLGGDDPRIMYYITDHRLTPPLPALDQRWERGTGGEGQRQGARHE